MKLFEYLDRISRMHKLVRQRNTGTPEELARRLGVSRTSLYELIDEMRSRGAPITYSKSTRTFFYEEPFDVSVTCSFRMLKEVEMSEINGGMIFFTESFFSGRCDQKFVKQENELILAAIN